MTCPHCQRPIYLGEDDDARLNPQEEEDKNSTTSNITFVELHNKILNAEKILKEKTLEVSYIEYEILDSYYPLREALKKKLTEFTSIHPLQTTRILLNAEIKRQFSSDISHNIFNKKKCSAKNIYNIFKMESLRRVEIKRIRRISPSSFRKFTDKEIKIIQERVRMNSSRPNWLKDQFDDLDLNEEGIPKQTD
ncbi:5707_t:CDS:2 [Funneliformis caledonium]|uniref:5707_t:CDS:1 n=1 Tax=Funneliformis caledonium TaxID=1117310 RepID=A0A9N9FC06_9GLOM|nr:5707_t:CDS:2 [Funneliformis caledonium]